MILEHASIRVYRYCTYYDPAKICHLEDRAHLMCDVPFGGRYREGEEKDA